MVIYHLDNILNYLTITQYYFVTQTMSLITKKIFFVTLVDARNSQLPELLCQPDTIIAYSQIKGNRYFNTFVLFTILTKLLSSAFAAQGSLLIFEFTMLFFIDTPTILDTTMVIRCWYAV